MVYLRYLSAIHFILSFIVFFTTTVDTSRVSGRPLAKVSGYTEIQLEQDAVWTSSHNSTHDEPAAHEGELEEESNALGAEAMVIILLAMMSSMVTFYFLETRGLSGYPCTDQTSLFIGYGLILGALVRFGLKALITYTQFSAKIFLLFLLPPIIFDAGYSMKRNYFFKHIVSILVFAIAGTLISTVVTSGLLIGFCALAPGTFGCVASVASAAPLPNASVVPDPHGAEPVAASRNAPYPFPLHVELASDPLLTPLDHTIFGSFISATDPVTVLGLFGALGVDDDLYALVFGESIFNDAIAMVVFDALRGFRHREVTFVAVLSQVGWFFVVCIGSVLLGVGLGLFGALLMKHTEILHHPHLEVSLLFVFSFVSYAAADALRLSGIIALFFSGATNAHYTYFDLSKEAKHMSHASFGIIAHVAEAVVFVQLGLALFDFDWQWCPRMFFPIVVSILLARATAVFSLGFLLNAIRKARFLGKLGRREWYIPVQFQVVMWWAGLRGALAFALSFEEGVPPTYASATLFLCYFTVLVFGGSTTTLLKVLRIKMIPNAASDFAHDHPEQRAPVETEYGDLNSLGGLWAISTAELDAEDEPRLDVEDLQGVLANPDGESLEAASPARPSDYGILSPSAIPAGLHRVGSFQMPLSSGTFVRLDRCDPARFSFFSSITTVPAHSRKFLKPIFTHQRRRAPTLGLAARTIAGVVVGRRHLRDLRAMREQPAEVVHAGDVNDGWMHDCGGASSSDMSFAMSPSRMDSRASLRRVPTFFSPKPDFPDRPGTSADS